MSQATASDPTRLIRHLEELTLNTAPAIHQHFYDGWVLRASGTETHRSNSVTALHESTLPLDEKVVYSESWYRLHQQPIIFRVNDALSPLGLDDLLQARGYSKAAETVVMTADSRLFSALADLPLGVKLVERDLADSLVDLHHMKGTAPQVMAQEIKRQALWRGPQTVLNLRSINGVVCSGMARLDGGHLGVFDIYTPENQRGKGYASILVQYLLAWGASHGARTAFLQVLVTNEPAIAVYKRLGLVPSYRYWSRLKKACVDEERAKINHDEC